MLFPFLDLRSEYAIMKNDIRAAVDESWKASNSSWGRR